LKDILEDKIATDRTEYGDTLFAEDFSIIIDLKPNMMIGLILF
jgi:hypothetical protein